LIDHRESFSIKRSVKYAIGFSKSRESNMNLYICPLAGAAPDVADTSGDTHRTGRGAFDLMAIARSGISARLLAHAVARHRAAAAQAVPITHSSSRPKPGLGPR
jgi:hypothetical protein